MPHSDPGRECWGSVERHLGEEVLERPRVSDCRGPKGTAAQGAGGVSWVQAGPRTLPLRTSQVDPSPGGSREAPTWAPQVGQSATSTGRCWNWKAHSCRAASTGQGAKCPEPCCYFPARGLRKAGQGEEGQSSSSGTKTLISRQPGKGPKTEQRWQRHPPTHSAPGLSSLDPHIHQGPGPLLICRGATPFHPNFQGGTGR